MKLQDEQQEAKQEDNSYNSPKNKVPFLNLHNSRLYNIIDKKINENRFQTPSQSPNHNGSQFSNIGLFQNSIQSICNQQDRNIPNTQGSFDEKTNLARMLTAQQEAAQSAKSQQPVEKFSDDYFSRKSNILKKLQLKVKMKQVTKFLPSRMQTNLNSDHIKWIGDISAFFSPKDKDASNRNIITCDDRFNTLNLSSDSSNYQFKKAGLFNLIYNVIKSIPIFHPTNKFRQLWYIVQLFLISIIVTLLPIQMVFSLKISDLLSKAGTNIIFLMMIFDIFIQMNTGYYFRGTAILDRSTIIRYYFKEHMFDGLIADLSLILHTWFFKDSHPWILLLYFFKLKALKGIEKRIFEFIQISPMNMNFILLLKLIMCILYVSHLFACIWVQVAYWEHTWMAKWNTISKTWMDDVAIIKEGSWQSQYIAAYYFSSVTMITVGYGDIKAENEVEMILCTLNMIIACGVFAFSINQIGFIFDQFGKYEKQISENMYVINRYMNEHKISSRAQYQIKQYLEYYWTQTQDNYEKQEKEIISQLTENLRFQIKQEANRLVIKDTNIFSSNFSQGFINRLVPYIKESTLIPDQFVIKQNSDDDDASIYFIKKGSLKVIFETQKNANLFKTNTGTQNLINIGGNGHLNVGNSVIEQLDVKVIGEGEYFGQIRFFTGQPRNASIKTKDFTKLLSIKREDFLNVIKQFPQDYEVLAQINHVYSLEGILQNCGIKCFSCSSLSHTINKCPYIQLTYDKFNLMKKYKQLESKQDRESCFVRERYQKQNAFQFLNNNSLSKFDFLDSISLNDYFDFCEGDDDKLEQDRQQSRKSVVANQNESINQCDDDSRSRNSLSNVLSNLNNIGSPLLINKSNPSFQQTNAMPHAQFNLVSPTLRYQSSHAAFGTSNSKPINESNKRMSLQGFDESKPLHGIGFQYEQIIEGDTVMKQSQESTKLEIILKKFESCIDQKCKSLNGLFQTFLYQPQVSNQNNPKNLINMKDNQDFFQKVTAQTINNNIDNRFQNTQRQANHNYAKLKSNSGHQQHAKNDTQSCMSLMCQQQNNNEICQCQNNGNNIQNSIPSSQPQKENNNKLTKQRASKYLNAMYTAATLNQFHLMGNLLENKAHGQKSEFYHEPDDGFENFRVFKKFLVHNNFDVIIKKFNSKQELFIEQQKQIILLKIQEKKNKRRQFKIQKYSGQSPHTNLEKSQYGIKMMLQDLNSAKLPTKCDRQEYSVSHLETSTKRIAGDEHLPIFHDSYRTINFPNYITTQDFQNKKINSICNMLQSARQNKLSTSSQVYDFDLSKEFNPHQIANLDQFSNQQSVIIDSNSDSDSNIQ